MYDIEYYEKMLREYSSTAHEISRIRWEWILDHCGKVKTVLDYGSGVGWFRAWRPKGVDVYSYDIGPYPQTGIPLMMFDVLCFWDVLEHIPNFDHIQPVISLAKNIAVTVPLFTGGDITKWKHFKPKEHLHYFTKETLTSLFPGFKHVYMAWPECPPREDVASFMFMKTPSRTEKTGVKRYDNYKVEVVDEG
ncbi:MAG: hypothetical protein JRJ31_16965 [Deltaproteobacteria bacterium]|nr:hypothetical protein [Deltaproteobacteria bacterium]